MATFPKIPGYRIEKELGQGGMATVFLAFEEKLQRLVAVKAMSLGALQDQSLARRFIKEARTAANLIHSNIVSIFDVGECDGIFFMAMEYLPSGSLRDRILGGSLTPEQSLAIIRQVAAALAYAHGEGFIHRDIKPENILFRKDNTSVLADFGIARAVGSTTKLTKTGMSIGTPHYMSPEQARGQAVDARSDLYSLGIVLFEMLTGKVPYDAEDTVAIAVKHVQEPVPELPAGLKKYQPLLDKLLAKDPKERVQSGAELGSMMQSLTGSESFPQTKEMQNASVSQRKTPSSPAMKPRVEKTARPENGEKSRVATIPKKGKLVFGLLALLAVLVVALLLIMGNIRQGAAPETAISHGPEIQTQSETKPEGAPAVDPSEQEYQKYLSQARASYENGALDKALRQLDLAKTIKSTTEVSNLEKLVRAEMERAAQAQIAAQAEKERVARLEIQRQQAAEAERVRQEAAARLATASRYTAPAVSLRSSYRTLGDEDAKAMAKRLGIFMSDWNPSASGINHQYESRTLSGDRVVVDRATGLMWHQSGSDKYMKYAAAQAWLSDLNRRGYAGFSDWRLPTMEEGASLLESSKKNGSLYIDPVFSEKQWWIWTGDSYSSAASWAVHFSIGLVYRFVHDLSSYVRPVRSGK